ncbi:hypothetical protein [Acidiphilium acidophilum]|uniref:hypothetical protein n=1 Tax=Acidiphilium acidophilum TaxID=76588 RepID=UPI002E8E6C61|nr:hypothetical protein [Acidiphilium acidophilum]
MLYKIPFRQNLACTVLVLLATLAAIPLKSSAQEVTAGAPVRIKAEPNLVLPGQQVILSGNAVVDGKPRTIRITVNRPSGAGAGLFNALDWLNWV